MLLPSTRPAEALQSAKAVMKSTPSKKPPVYTLSLIHICLQVVTEFMPISARFIANKASYPFKHRQMDTMLEKLRDTLHKQEEEK